MKVTKRQLRQIIREEKRRIIREQAKDDSGRYLPNPQFPKMTYPEDRAKMKDPAVALEGIVAAVQHALSLGVSGADIIAAVKSEV